MKRNGMLVAFLITVSALTSRGFAKELAEILPKNTSAVIEMNSPQTMWENLNKNGVLPNISREELKKSWKTIWEGAWEKQLREIFEIQPLDLLLKYPDKIGVSIGNITPLINNMINGQPLNQELVSLGVFFSSPNKEEFSQTFNTFIEKGIEYCNKNDAECSLQKEDYHNIPFSILRLRPEKAANEKAQGDSPNKIYFAWVDNWLVLTVSRSYLEKVLEVSEGAPALNKQEDYLEARETINTKTAEIFGYADFQKIFDPILKVASKSFTGISSPGENSKKTDEIIKQYEDFLFGDIKYVALKGGFVKNGIYSDFFAACDPNKPKGVLHLIGRKENLGFPSWVWQDDNCQCSAMALDSNFTKKFVSKLLTMIYKAQYGPDQAEMWKSQFSMFMGIDLEKDLLGSIGEQLVMLQDVNPQKQEDSNSPINQISPQTPELLYSISLTREEPWNKLLQHLAALLQGNLKQVDYLGKKLYAIGGGNQVGINIRTGTVNKFFLAGTQNFVEKAVRRLGKDDLAAAKNPEMEEALLLTGRPNAMLGWQTIKIVDSLYFKTAKKYLNQFSQRLAREDDPVVKELAKNILNLVNTLIDPKKWKGIKINSLGMGNWEAKGLKAKNLVFFIQKREDK